MLRTPRPATLLAKARRTWRRSLQLRVITISLIASGALMITFGLVVGNVITNGMVKSRQETAKVAVDEGSLYASQQFNAQILSPDDSLAGGIISGVVRTLTQRSN